MDFRFRTPIIIEGDTENRYGIQVENTDELPASDEIEEFPEEKIVSY
jgi:hypothetical protein